MTYDGKEFWFVWVGIASCLGNGTLQCGLDVTKGCTGEWIGEHVSLKNPRVFPHLSWGTGLNEPILTGCPYGWEELKRCLFWSCWLFPSLFLLNELHLKVIKGWQRYSAKTHYIRMPLKSKVYFLDPFELVREISGAAFHWYFGIWGNIFKGWPWKLRQKEKGF